ncbi:gastrula zinc finger protein XlCGF46.1-like [Anopheles marshallii]|uniref:gastrula zinc finger protein XlCGF46.1-like n=1 Tax=Anopheles marshallii TaxID=1521116 RepID=UPI00237B6DEA|nr:gastrula zinc finger protein XlCGF46.1-like [Anopheles marshallii]
MDNILDLRIICCTCLNVTHSTISIYHQDLKYNVSFAEMINKICLLEFKPNDECPDKLCYTCADKLRTAYDFRLMCDDSRTILLRHRKNTPNSSTMELSQTGAEGLNSEGIPTLLDTSNDLIEYDGEVEYLEEYLLDTEHTIPSSTGENLAQNINDSVVEECIDYEPTVEEQSIAEEDNRIFEIDAENETNQDQTTDEDETLENEHRCTICGVVLSKMAHLRRHMKAHSAAKPHRCTQCSKTFTRSDNLRVHEANHSQERRFHCPQCDQCYKTMNAMKQHMSVRHKGFVEANFHVCTICSAFFKTKEQLNVHMNKHRIDNRLVCYVCGKTFVDMLRYDVHVKKHATADSEPLECFHCSKQFPSKAQLMLHIRYYSAEKSFKCKYCETSFSRSTDLKTHEDYHTGTKNHACKTCGKSFHRRNALKTHMMIHTEEKPYQCSHCPKKFRQKYDMITHERRHTGERFQCDMCVEKFIHAHQLNSHLKIVHKCAVQCRKRGVTKIFNEPEFHSGSPSVQSDQGNEI